VPLSETFLFILAGVLIFILTAALVAVIVLLICYAVKSLPTKHISSGDLELGLSPLSPSFNTPAKANNCTTNINITSSNLNFYKIHNYNSPQIPKLQPKPHPPMIDPKPSNLKTTTADVHPVCSHLHHGIDAEIKKMTRELTGCKSKRKSHPVSDASELNKISSVADSDVDNISLESTNPFKK
jgi:hypothetical protein